MCVKERRVGGSSSRVTEGVLETEKGSLAVEKELIGDKMMRSCC